MKYLTIFALALATATATYLPVGEMKSRNILLPVGRPEGRITNGHTASDGQIPYQVGLSLEGYNGGSGWCGGTLLSHTKVLTAAHCTDGRKQGTVYLGSATRRTSEITHKFTANDIIIHSGWNGQLLTNDISIINIPYTEYTGTIQPVKLPSGQNSDSSFSGEVTIAAGWGRTGDKANSPATLQYGYLYVLSNDLCKNHHGSYITPSHICVTTDHGVSTCPGDSGGPLVLATTKELIGVTSFISGYSCESGFPAVFTRVTKYLDWIKQNAGV